MLFLDNINDITKNSDSYKYMTRTMNCLEKTLEVQYVKRKALTQILDQIANMQMENVAITNTSNLLSIIESIKETLDKIRDNIESSKKLLNEIKDIILRIDKLISNGEKDLRLKADINYFYMLYIEKQNMIEESNIKYEKLLLNTYEYVFFNISNIEKNKETSDLDKSEEKKEENKIESAQKNEANIQDETKISQTEKEDEASKDTNQIQDLSKEIIDNNTLVISEMQNKVFLPYKVSELEKVLKENEKKYESIQDLIDKKYVVSLDRYKNATFARFKEAYHLMREKEKSSFSEALDLALEVTFKYNLNPAIITACRNLDELDVYLDCLDQNELDDFKIFDIRYDVAPMKV